jgi:RsiW-degrading membrane proteinase PrsW (M82 family)
MDAILDLAIALIGSLVATVIYVVIVWRLDRYEKEPVRLLGLAFLWGMIPAVIMSVFLEDVWSSIATALAGETISDFLGYIFAAPVVEESIKGLALLVFLVFAYREVDDILDGIIYGAMVGLGFAFTENVFYVASGLAQHGVAVGVAILFLRTVVFGMNHAFYSAVLGAGVGDARLTRGVRSRLTLLGGAWLAGVSFHALHNLGTTAVGSAGLGALALSVLADWGGILGMLLLVALMWRVEERWMAEELASEVGTGVLTPELYAAVTTQAGRQRLLARTLQREGWASFRQQQRQYGLLTELAFKKHQARVMQSERADAEDVERLRTMIRREQATMLGPAV